MDQLIINFAAEKFKISIKKLWRRKDYQEYFLGVKAAGA
jgi:hypothetical protein